MAKVVDCGIDPLVDACERDIVRGRTGIVNDRIDKSSCGFRFPFDLRAFFLESLQMRRSACFVWWRLHLCNDHPTKQESARSSDRISTRAKSAYAGMYLFVNSSSK